MRKKCPGIILLAAGASVRMGEPKQLLRVGGQSLIQRAVKVAGAANFGPVVVVLGANADLIQPELAGLEIQVAVNLAWQTGMASSIRCGLKALLAMSPECDGVLLMLADQPSITEASLRKITEAAAEGDARTVAARYHQILGTPAFFSRDYFPDLLELQGQGGAGKLLQRLGNAVRPVDLPEAALDLDTPEEFAAFNREKAEDAGYAETTTHDLPAFREAAGIGQTRRQFMTNVLVASAGVVVAPSLLQKTSGVETDLQKPLPTGATVPIKLRINGAERSLQLDLRVTLLDLLRDKLDLTGSKKGCDHGQCGACTVLVNGRRMNACLSLAVMHDGDEITTIEGLADGEELHPVQTAFLEQDGFQCGYCTPGQICSAVALLKEGHAGSDAEIREWMSGNLCRCGAYINIVAAIREAKNKTSKAL